MIAMDAMDALLQSSVNHSDDKEKFRVDLFFIARTKLNAAAWIPEFVTLRTDFTVGSRKDGVYITVSC